MYVQEISEQLEGLNLICGVHYFKEPWSIFKLLLPKLRGDVEKFNNLHQGERAFIIGNGPSLRISDLELLKNEITFASNSIHVAFDDTGWRPTYYSVIDNLSAKSNCSSIRKVPAIKFFYHYMYPLLGDIENSYWLNGEYLFSSDERVRGFSENIAEKIYYGATVTYTNLQLAHYMGFKEIYLLGVDYQYQGIPEMQGSEISYTRAKEQNAYFHPNYHNVGEACHRPNLDRHYKAYIEAHRFLKEHGVKVYNASRSTALDVFPCVNFDDIITET